MLKIVEKVKKLHEIKRKYRSKEQLTRIKEFIENVQTGVSEEEFFRIVEDVTGIRISKKEMSPPKFRKRT